MRKNMIVTLKDITTKITKGTTPTSIGCKFEKSGINFIKSESLVDGKTIDKSKFAFISERTHERLKRSQIEENDILFSMAGMFLGKTGIATAEVVPANTNQAVAIIRVDDTKANYEYVYYYLNQKSVIHTINTTSAQSAQPNINLKQIGKIKINLPNRKKQDQIVSLLSAIDLKISNNVEINDNLYAQVKAIFSENFLNLDFLPDGWKTGNLLDIADYLNGLAMQKYRPKDGETGLPVLKIKELRQGICDANSELCSPSIKSEYIIHGGDIIFSWSGSLLVDIWCGGTCGLNQHLFKVTSNNYDKWFYYLWTAHHLDRFIAVAADKATTMGHIKREELEKAEVIIPSKCDYKRISTLIKPLFDLIISNRIENRKLTALRNTLLPKIMSGEIDVSDIQL